MVVNLLLFDELGEILKTVKQEIDRNRIQTQFKIVHGTTGYPGNCPLL